MLAIAPSGTVRLRQAAGAGRRSASRAVSRPALRLNVAAMAETEQMAGTADMEAAVAAGSRKAGPLQKGGTLSGIAAAGKNPGAAARGIVVPTVDWKDERWVNGTWDLNQFKNAAGETLWDSVLDAEIGRRKYLEARPEPVAFNTPISFDTSVIPWWVWVRRFHLPEAEKLNGRACMVGYILGYFVDLATGHGLVDQQNSFLGKILIFVTIVGTLMIRKNSDVAEIQSLVAESTLYDKQWQATWEGKVRPSETEK